MVGLLLIVIVGSWFAGFNQGLTINVGAIRWLRKRVLRSAWRHRWAARRAVAASVRINA